MNRGYGVQVIPRDGQGAASVQPFVIVAADERDAELLAAAARDGAEVQVIRALTDDEARDYGLDLGRRGDMKALPVLNF